MIDNSKAYKKLKKQSQESMDFIILCCHAVPSLKGYIKAVENNAAPKLPDPDIFVSPTSIERLKEISPKYRKTLGKLLILNSFSYFEAYVIDLLKEIFEFHGGDEKFLQAAIQKRNVIFDGKFDPVVRKLREPAKKGKEAKYRKLRAELINGEYRFPTDIFSVYGIMRMQERLKELKASQIPDLLKDALGLSLSESDLERFSNMRELRNDIAHGKVSEVDLKKAIDDNDFLRTLAVKIDSHVINYFFVIDE